MSYRSKLNKWFSQMQREGYIPRNYSRNMFSAPGASDEALYSMAMSLYNSVVLPKASKSPIQANENERFFLVPHVENGNVYYMDRFRGRVAFSMVRQPNGLFSYMGPRKYMQIVGGRGELGELLKRTEDGDFFYDKKAA